MKIGVFGDSYAIGHKESADFHWYNLLSKKLDAVVETYGMGATSVYYSYKNFIKYHKKYDLNIFLVTHYSRYTKPIFSNWYASINSVEDHLKNPNLKKDEKIILEFLKGWFVMSDDNFLKLTQDLLVGKILELRSNTLIIPCWENEGSLLIERQKELKIDPTGNCWTFNKKALPALNIKTFENLEEKMSKIACHFTPEISEIFADAVYNKIKYDTPIVCPLEIKHDYPLEYYYNILP